MSSFSHYFGLALDIGDTIFSGPEDWGPKDLGTWNPGTQIGMHSACAYGSLKPR